MVRKTCQELNSKLAQKECKKNTTGRRVIHWVSCKKVKFQHTNKWYKHKPEAILENETRGNLWNLDILTYCAILARRPDVILMNKWKKICHLVDFAVPEDFRKKLKGKWKKEKNWTNTWSAEKLWNMKVAVILIVVGAQ